MSILATMLALSGTKSYRKEDFIKQMRDTGGDIGFFHAADGFFLTIQARQVSAPAAHHKDAEVLSAERCLCAPTASCVCLPQPVLQKCTAHSHGRD